MVSNLFQVVTLFSSGEREEDFGEGRVEDVHGELFQVVVEGVGEEEVKNWSGQQGESGAKGQAKQSREIVWACLEMLELGKSDVVEELDQELTRDVLLVGRESFDSNEDGGGGDDKDEESVDVECWEEMNLDGDRVGQG